MNAKELQGIEFLFHGIQVLATDGSGPGRAVRGRFLLLETIRYLPETQVECATHLRPRNLRTINLLIDKASLAAVAFAVGETRYDGNVQITSSHQSVSSR